MKKQFTEKEISMVLKHRKRCLTSFIIRSMQIETDTKSKNETTFYVGRDVGKGHPYTAGGNRNCCRAIWKYLSNI